MPRPIVALLLATLLFSPVGFFQVGQAAAAPQRYVFAATKDTIPAGPKAILSVRLLNTASGQPVTGAVIFQTRLDMSPDGMGDMSGSLAPLPSDEPGVYRFQADLGMAGRWLLKLAAKVPGEPDTVRGEVLVTATEQ